MLLLVQAGSRAATIGGKTVTVNVALAVFPAPSTAETVTVVMPTGKSEPEAGLAELETTPLLSVALVVKVTTAPERLVASTTTGAGSAITGGVVSVTAGAT